MKTSLLNKFGSALVILTMAFWFVYNPSQEVTVKKKSKSAIKPTKKSLIVNGKRYDGPEKFAYYQAAVRAGQADLEAPLKYPQYRPFQKSAELQKALKTSKFKSRDETTAVYKERGPANVPGRTRTILIDPDDASQNTWFAGNVTGGIWKTTDAGASWVEIAPELDNLSIVTMAMAESNSSVIYAGTGEGWMGGTVLLNGDGIYKSTDKGVTWNKLTSTNNETFINVSRIIVDPADENIVLATTSSAKAVGAGIQQSGTIMRSTDGGNTWTQVFAANAPVQQIIAAPTDFDIQYATVGSSNGVYRSDDAGLTWTSKNSGLLLAGRIELGVSYSDSDKLYGSAQGGGSGSGSDLYVSDNGGDSWDQVSVTFNDAALPWLGSQGWYDNCVMVHPFDDDKVYLGGVGVHMVEVNPDDAQTTDAYTINTEEVDSFVTLVGFSDGEGGANLEVGSSANETKVEIRFGAGKGQKAHRFLVPEGEGAGVPDADFSYADYVDVPFEAWDVTNDRQLMLSFRDQQRNGTFELIERNTDGDASTHSREYVYVSNVDYDDANPNESIAADGGHIFESMYFIWPHLTADAEWTPETYEDSNIVIDFESFSVLGSTLTVVSDPYDEFDSKNSFFSGNNLHPDHHWVVPIITDEANEQFKLLNGNDGGIYTTLESANPGTEEGDFIFSGSGYNTTQFYGADKVAGEERYWGGAQDNGTWLSPAGISDATSNYTFIIGGDGFEAINHYTDPLKMIGGSQFNGFFGTDDGWATNFNAQGGLGGNGPFISRLSSAYQDPDVLFTVEADGVYKSTDFGRNWRAIPITEGWQFWSGIDVEVSKADPRIVWAGGSMSSDGNLFVSVDAGETFEPVPNFADIGLSTGLYSHPTKDSTAFAVFSVADSPKVLRTDDLGQTWEDISGFSAGSTSTGFPNVATFALQAMPYDDNVLWAGTEIGLFESLDAGETWNIIDEFPSVIIWDFKIKDGQVVIATHGRGIWTADIDELSDFTAPEVPLTPEIVSVAKSFTDLGITVSINLKSTYDSTLITSNEETVVIIPANAEVGVETVSFTVSEAGTYEVRGIAYSEGAPYFTTITTLEVTEPREPVDSYFSDFENSEMDIDFSLDNFTFGIASGGFFTRGLNTEHPYPTGEDVGANSVDLTANLNIPIIVGNELTNIRFDEVVLVEEGEAGTSFGDVEFWDYVIVEGTLNGVDWIPLLDGYDSDANDLWDGSATSATGELYVSRQINLAETFEAGDLIQLRFRLFSDVAVSAWGWGIDNLEIQLVDADGDGFSVATDCDDNNPDINPGAEDIPDNGIDENCDGENLVTSVSDVEEGAINVYPIPAQDQLSVEISNQFQGNVQIELMSLNGKVMLKDSFNHNSQQISRKLNTASLSTGLYLLKISDNSSSITRRVVIK